MDRYKVDTVKADGVGDRIIPVGKYAVRLLMFPATMGKERYGINVTDTETWETPFYLTRIDRFNMWRMLCGIYTLAGMEWPSPYFLSDGEYVDFLNVQAEPQPGRVAMA